MALDTVKQPVPLVTDRSRPVHESLMGYFETRRQLGLEKYGVPLVTHNRREALLDLRDELADALLYLEQLIMELEDN